MSNLPSHPEVEAVVLAVRNPGPHPAYHRKVMREVEKLWPTLARAVNELVVAYEREEAKVATRAVERYQPTTKRGE